MSLHYLLDGYNIIHRMSLAERATLEDQRRQLIEWLALCRPHGSSRNAVTVVFDGRSDVYSGAGLSSEIQIIFSKDENADAKLIRMVEESASRKRMVVVSDDRAVQYAVRALGASVSSVQAFWSKARLAQKSRGNQTEKYIPKTLGHKITSELAKIWLREGKE